MLDIAIFFIKSMFLDLTLYLELSTNLYQVKVECDKWQCSGKMLCLIESGGDERWKVN